MVSLNIEVVFVVIIAAPGVQRVFLASFSSDHEPNGTSSQQVAVNPFVSIDHYMMDISIVLICKHITSESSGIVSFQFTNMFRTAGSFNNVSLFTCEIISRKPRDVKSKGNIFHSIVPMIDEISNIIKYRKIFRTSL